MLVVDGAGIGVACNTAAARVFAGAEFASSDLRGRPVEDLVPEVLHAAHLEHRAGFAEDAATASAAAGRNVAARHLLPAPRGAVLPKDWHA